MLTFECCCQINFPVANFTRYLCDKGDYESMGEELLNTDWNSLFQDLNIFASYMWEVFYSKILFQ